MPEVRPVRKHGMGWLPDYPDFRDYTPQRTEVSTRLKALRQPGVQTMLTKVGVVGRPKVSLKPKEDLRAYCSPIEDQESLGSCTANAGVALVEYFERRAFGRHIDASRLFLYKTTRNLLHLTGDTGAYLRTTMAALTLFGVPPEEYWPYDNWQQDFEKEPPAFCYSFAQNYQAISYYRLDATDTTPADLLNAIKTDIAAGLPSMFGFTVYTSINQSSTTGKIPFPTPGENIEGGHAVAAVGYDDSMKIKNTNPDGIETTGAFLIRNSWGTTWGEGGYGWLPYEYVLRGLAEDWWTIIKGEWVDTGKFGLPEK